jgi:hypothetical protein
VEAPEFGESIISYDATNKGRKLFAHLAQEVIKRKIANNCMAKAMKQTLGMVITLLKKRPTRERY